jgi:hypothetical protein
VKDEFEKVHPVRMNLSPLETAYKQKSKKEVTFKYAGQMQEGEFTIDRH